MSLLHFKRNTAVNSVEGAKIVKQANKTFRERVMVLPPHSPIFIPKRPKPLVWPHGDIDILDDSFDWGTFYSVAPPSYDDIRKDILYNKYARKILLKDRKEACGESKQNEFKEEMWSSLIPEVKVGINEESKEYLDDKIKDVKNDAKETREGLESFFTKFSEVLGSTAENVTESFSSNIEKIMASLSAIKVEHKIDWSFGSMFKSLARGRIGDLLESFMNTIKKITSNRVGSYLINFIFAFALIYVLIKHMKLSMQVARMIAMTIVVGLAVKGEDFNSLLWKWADYIVLVRNEFCEESDYSSLVKLTYGTIFAYIYNTTSSSMPDKLLAGSATLSRLNKGVEITVELFSDLIVEILHTFGSVCNIEFLKNLGIKTPRVVEITERVNDIAIKMRSTSERFMSEVNEELCSYIRELHTILNSDYPKIKECARERSEIIMLINEIKKLTLLTCKGTSSKGGARAEPMVFVLIGESGIGKSQLNEKLIFDVTPRILGKIALQSFEKNPQDQIYTVDHQQEFEDGYTGQEVLRFDDIFQMKDVAGNPNTNLLKVIAYCNGAPAWTNNAALELKNFIAMRASLVMATDNNERLSDNVIKSLNCPQAAARRFDLPIRCIVKEEYGIPAPDGKVVPPRNRKVRPDILLDALRDPTGQLITKLHEFHLYDWGSGKFKAGCYTYEGLRDLIVQMHKEKAEIGACILQGLDKTKNDAVTFRKKELGLVNEISRADYIAKARVKLETLHDTVKMFKTTGMDTEDNAAYVSVLDLIGKTQYSIDDFDSWIKTTRFKEESIEFRETMVNFNIAEVLSIDLPDGISDMTKDERFKFVTTLWHAYKDKFKDLLLRTHPDKIGINKQFYEVKWSIDILKDPNLFLQYMLVRDSGLDAKTANEIFVGMGDLLKYDHIANYDGITTFWELDAWCIGALRVPKYDWMMPSQEYIMYMADRLGTTPIEMRGFFINKRVFENDTPMADVAEAWISYLYEIYERKMVSIKKSLSWIKDCFIEYFTYAKILAVVAASAGSIVLIYKYFVKEYFVEESERPVRKLTKTTKKQPKIITKPKMTEEAVVTSKAFIDVQNAIVKNICWLSFVKGGTPIGMVTFIGGKVSASVLHIIDKLKEDGHELVWLQNDLFAEQVDLTEITSDHTVSIGDDKGKVLNDDGGYILWPIKHEFGTIMTHLLSVDDKPKSPSAVAHYGVMLQPKWKIKEGIYTLLGYNGLVGHARPIAPEIYGTADWEAGDAITYGIHTGPGYCGLPFIVNDERALRPYISSIHVAGNGTMGIAINIYKDHAQMAIDEFRPFMEESAGFENYQEKLPYGWRIRKEIPYQRVGTKSKLRHTKLYGKWGTYDKLPALLRERTVRDDEGNIISVMDPWFIAREPYGVTTKRNWNKMLIHDIARKISISMRRVSINDYPWAPIVFSKEQVSAGIPKHMKGIPRNTSAGYPWKEYGRKKYEFFGKGDDYDFSSLACQDVFAAVDDKINDILQGRKLDTQYLQVLKDELRSAAKRNAGKSRLVMASALDKTILTCMYFKDFIRHCQDNRIINGIAIGINPSSVESKILKSRHMAHGDNCHVAGDFGNWDGDQPEEFDEGYEIIVEGYYYNSTEEDRIIRSAIIEATSKTSHVITIDDKSFIVEVDEIMPSGDALTGNKNSVCNNIRSAYVRAHMKLKQLGFSGHMDYDGVNLDLDEILLDIYTSFGDDHILSVAPCNREGFTELSYGTAMRELGFKYTDANKRVELEDRLKSFDEVSFLKRVFRELPGYPGYVFAVLELEVVLFMSYWKEKGAPIGTEESTIDTTAKELAPHGMDVWKEYAWKISKTSLEELGHQSAFLPSNDSEAELLRSWKVAIAAYQCMEVEYA